MLNVLGHSHGDLIAYKNEQVTQFNLTTIYSFAVEHKCQQNLNEYV